MFLTRMALDVNREDTARLLLDRGKINQAVLSAFEYGRVLWRIDELSHRTWLVMLSRIRPDLTALHQQYGYLGAFPSWETLDFDRELDDADDGTVWDFELCAAPVGTAPAVRESWTEPEFLTEWLARQGNVDGFRIQHSRVEEAVWLPIGDQQLLLVRWTGRLYVTDEELFRWAVTSGIGGARELGAGLMTIAGRGNVWGI